MAVSQESTSARLKELYNQGLSPRRLILASNRGPVEYYLTRNGQLQSRRGSGGVSTALATLGNYVELDWFASAMGEGDREVALRARGKPLKVPLADKNLRLHFVVTPENTYHKFYNTFCNPVLYFLLHDMWNSPYAPDIDHGVYDAWESGYVPVNQDFAQAIIADVAEDELPSIIFLNDYQLFLTSGYIRRQMPDSVILYFIHVPWPSPNSWQLLPNFMREAIVRSLCSADIIGLQTERDVHNFLYSCQSFIDECEIHYKQRTIRLNKHTVQVRAYPISIDVVALKKLISSPKLQEYEEKLHHLCGEKTIVRVERADLNKNIIRGFKAFDILLERYPQFLGKVKFIAFLVPTRTHIEQYQIYKRELIQLIEAINDKYRIEEWHPIDLFYEDNSIQSIAGMRLYDVLLVNSLKDGMNLVAKEGPTVNNRDGVLILSETVGAYEQLGQNALTVAPADLEGTTQALYTALTMPADERHKRAIGLKKSIEEEDLTNWLLHLLQDAVNLIEQPETST